MSTAAPIAPTKAAGVTRLLCSGKSSKTRMPMSPAPDEMPMMCGSASGFFMMACRMVPASARSMPTSAATSVRGSRMFQRICACVPPAPARAPRISCNGISTDPIIMLMTPPASANRKKSSNMRAMRPRPGLAPIISRTPPGRGTSPSSPLLQDSGYRGSAGRDPAAGSRRGPL